MKTIMSSRVENVWEATISPDDRRREIYGYYDSYEKACESVMGKSWYGSDGFVSQNPQQALTIEYMDGSTTSFILDKGFEIQRESEKDKEERLKRLREQALSKLSPSEREALGL